VGLGLKIGIPDVLVTFLHTHTLSILHSSMCPLCLSSISVKATDQMLVQTGPDMLATLLISGSTSTKFAKPSTSANI